MKRLSSLIFRRSTGRMMAAGSRDSIQRERWTRNATDKRQVSLAFASQTPRYSSQPAANVDSSSSSYFLYSRFLPKRTRRSQFSLINIQCNTARYLFVRSLRWTSFYREPLPTQPSLIGRATLFFCNYQR